MVLLGAPASFIAVRLPRQGKLVYEIKKVLDTTNGSQD
jgi:hypothetical protein